MDIFLVIIGFICILIGIIGCIVPVLPGPPLSYVGLLLLQFSKYGNFTTATMIILALAVIIITILDYVVPSWGTKKAGGTKWGVRGSAIGLIIGLFFAPAGIFIGPFVGAFLGEILYRQYQNKKSKDNFSKSLKAAFGSFLGLIFGIALKIAISCFIAFLFVKEFIINL
ncbi:MAG TPA: DUF456 domain-containing protein [Bacteroidales bacterium]|jgi:hypothetical protein|nr:DUF456 domain-containing protein [Bacteroidales bacterium]